MSVLGKKPFVNKIIESLSTEQIVKLRKLIDNPTDLRTIALYGVDNLLSENDKGVHFVKCKLEELSLRIVQGFLCYADDDNCALFVFNNGSDIVEEYVIYPKVRKFERVYEYLNAEEFRRVLDDSEEQGGSEAWSESMKDKMVFNSATNTVEIGTNLYVDGKISLSGVDDIKKYTDDSVQALKDLVSENYAEKTYVDNQLNLCVKLTDIDTDFSLTSTNALQNKVVSKQIKDINYTIMTMKEELFETVLSEIDYKVDYATIYPIPDTLSDNDGTHRVVYSDTQLKEIEGNSVAFNQFAKPFNISSVWACSSALGTLSNKTERSIFYTRNNVEQASNVAILIQNMSAGYATIKGHKYFIKTFVNPSDNFKLNSYVGSYAIGKIMTANVKNNYEVIITANNDGFLQFISENGGHLPLGGTVLFEDTQLFDLTASGIDFVTTVDEAKAELLKRGINVDKYNEFNAGEIRSTIIKGVRIRNSKLATVPLNKIGVVDLGTLEWVYVGTSYNAYAQLPNAKKVSSSVLSNMLCSNYKVYKEDDITAQTKGISFANVLIIKDSSLDGKTAEEIKTAMSGVMLYY